MIAPASMRIPRKKNGIVYRVGNEARFVITTSTSDIMATMISPNAAPFISIVDIVKGKKTAA